MAIAAGSVAVIFDRFPRHGSCGPILLGDYFPVLSRSQGGAVAQLEPLAAFLAPRFAPSQRAQVNISELA